MQQERIGGEDGDENAESWKDALMGMQPHERAEVYESKGMYREALRWHRQELAAARERVEDGEEEDYQTAGLDLARALRNTGRCLGKLDMEGFAEVCIRGVFSTLRGMLCFVGKRRSGVWVGALHALRRTRVSLEENPHLVHA